MIITATVIYSVYVEVVVPDSAAEDQKRAAICQAADKALDLKRSVITECSEPGLED